MSEIKHTMPESDVVEKIAADHEKKRPNFGKLLPTVDYNAYMELVEALESIMSLVKVHQKHPIIAEKVQQAQQALNKAKGLGDDK